MAKYPVLARKITIPSGGQTFDIEWSTPGSDTCTIAAGTYYLDEDSSVSGSLCDAIKDAIAASSYPGTIDDVTYTASVDGSGVTGVVAVDVLSGATIALDFSSGTFDGSLIGYSAARHPSSSYLGAVSGDVSPTATWVANQPSRILDDAPPEVEGVYMHRTPGGALYTAQTADTIAKRVVSMEHLAQSRCWSKDTTSDAGRALQAFWQAIRGGVDVRLYEAAVSSGTDLEALSPSNRSGTYKLDQLAGPHPFNPTRPDDMANLYAIDLNLVVTS